ncbi:MAG: hypothetical protein KC657_24465 [Myxococcales bacterium]|nr:hypothetical protein [Myxococcales bacterium]
MPLDDATRRLRETLDAQVLDLRDVAELRGLRSEELRFDSVAQRVTRQTKHGEIVGRWYAELLATYYLRDSIFRWAWAGTSSSYSTYGERIFKEGQQREVPQLCMSVVGGVTPEDADVLTQLGLALTGARDLFVEEPGDGTVKFYGMYDSPRPSGLHVSVPPPPVRRASSPPASERPGRSRSTTSPEGPAAKRSAPPPADRPREPDRAAFFPVASLAHELLARDVPGFSQAVLTLTIDPAARQTRLMVQLAAVDAGGRLRAVDATRELLDAATELVTAERARGAGAWRKLEAHLAPKSDGGATLHVEVV